MQVHRSGDSGSPRLVGSTRASRSASSVGSPAFARAGSWKSSACAPLPAAEPVPTAHPGPIPSGPARSCSAQPQSPSRPLRSHHNPRRMPPPPRPDDGPVHREKGHRRKSLSDGIDIDHPHNIWYSNLVVNPYITLSKVDSIIYGRALSRQRRCSM